jgi:serine/threonine protein kinase
MFHSAQGSPWNGKSPLSLMSSPMFYSATSSPYVNAVHTSSGLVGAQDGTGNDASSSDPPVGAMPPPPKPKTEYMKAIRTRGLVLPLDQELNWSGKTDGGQHVEFAKGEELPFKVLGTIGASLTATVDKVRCRRILLARKTMLCGRRIPLQDALAEVEHLQKLRHCHIIQLVGSYLQGKRFSVLLYPVADYDLGKFLERVSDDIILSSSDPTVTYPELEVQASWSFFGCLTDALQYIHSKATRHLDIKPGNILVKRGSFRSGYRVYIADFGISKSFSSLDHSQTDDPIPRTPKYCAPEVWERVMYGRAADIFSLGCVFTEMLTVLAGQDLDEFADFRSQGGEGKGAFRESLSEVTVWMRRIQLILDKEKYRFPWSGVRPSVDVVLAMLEERPERRRLWEHIRGGNQFCSFCQETREIFREEPSEEIEIE